MFVFSSLGIHQYQFIPIAPLHKKMVRWLIIRTVGKNNSVLKERGRIYHHLSILPAKSPGNIYLGLFRLTKHQLTYFYQRLLLPRIKTLQEFFYLAHFQLIHNTSFHRLIQIEAFRLSDIEHNFSLSSE